MGRAPHPPGLRCGGRVDPPPLCQLSGSDRSGCIAATHQSAAWIWPATGTAAQPGAGAFGLGRRRREPFAAHPVLGESAVVAAPAGRPGDVRTGGSPRSIRPIRRPLPVNASSLHSQRSSGAAVEAGKPGNFRLEASHRICGYSVSHAGSGRGQAPFFLRDFNAGPEERDRSAALAARSGPSSGDSDSAPTTRTGIVRQ